MLEESSRSSGCAPHASLKMFEVQMPAIFDYLILFDVIWYYLVIQREQYTEAVGCADAKASSC